MGGSMNVPSDVDAPLREGSFWSIGKLMLVDVVEAELGSSKARPLGRSRPNAGQLALAFNMRSLAEIQSGF